MLPRCDPDRIGLGMDSLGIFYIDHNESAFAQAADVQPFVDHTSIWWLLQPEHAVSWNEEYIKCGEPKRRFARYDPNTGYPGHHYEKYSILQNHTQLYQKDY